MNVIYAPFVVAEYLDNKAVVSEYLSAAVEDPNPDVFASALHDVAKALGVRVAEMPAAEG